MFRHFLFAMVFCVVLSVSATVLNLHWDWCEPFFFAFGLSVSLVWARKPRSFTVKMKDGTLKVFKYCVAQLDQERDEKSVCVSNRCFVEYPTPEERKSGIRWVEQKPRPKRKSDELTAVEVLTELVKQQSEQISALQKEICDLREALGG